MPIVSVDDSTPAAPLQSVGPSVASRWRRRASRGQGGDPGMEQRVRLAAGRVRLAGDLAIPAAAKGVVLFAHGSGSGRLSPRKRLVTGTLQQAGLATLLLDLLTAEEETAERAGASMSSC